MPQLKDKCIRQALIHHLNSQQQIPRAVLEEVRVHNGNAIADVVEIADEVHCYEIKGATDSIERISRQGAFYDLAFPFVTLVTTSNQLPKAQKIAPRHWGIIVADSNGISVVLKNKRKARRSSKFDRELALLTLWKDELLSLIDATKSKPHTLNRRALTKMLADHLPDTAVSRIIGQKLLDRHVRAA